MPRGRERIAPPPRAGGWEMRISSIAFNSPNTAEAQVYARYESGRQHFVRYYSLLNEFLEQQQIEALTPTQCEITYVNHVKGIEGTRGQTANSTGGCAVWCWTKVNVCPHRGTPNSRFATRCRPRAACGADCMSGRRHSSMVAMV